MPETLLANILAVCGWDPGRVTVPLSTLSCSVSPSSLPFVPLYFAVPPVLFPVPL